MATAWHPKRVISISTVKTTIGQDQGEEVITYNINIIKEFTRYN